MSLRPFITGTWETDDHVLGAVFDLVMFGLPDDYYQQYPLKIMNMTRAEVVQAAKILVKPDHVVWVIVGDRSKIEPSLRELDIADFHYMDADGNIIE